MRMYLCVTNLMVSVLFHEQLVWVNPSGINAHLARDGAQLVWGGLLRANAQAARLDALPAGVFVLDLLPALPLSTDHQE